MWIFQHHMKNINWIWWKTAQNIFWLCQITKNNFDADVHAIIYTTTKFSNKSREFEHVFSNEVSVGPNLCLIVILTWVLE